tara:strand:- start:137 stop:355 length:219 start_codon:yes stop_codon:yes gene_type:complete
MAAAFDGSTNYRSQTSRQQFGFNAPLHALFKPRWDYVLGQYILTGRFENLSNPKVKPTGLRPWNRYLFNHPS